MIEGGMGGTVTIQVDGCDLEALPGVPLGAVLHERGPGIRRSPRLRQLRGLYCGMGVCFECVVRVDGVGEVRACLTPVRAGMSVTTDR